MASRDSHRFPEAPRYGVAFRRPGENSHACSSPFLREGSPFWCVDLGKLDPSITWVTTIPQSGFISQGLLGMPWLRSGNWMATSLHHLAEELDIGTQMATAGVLGEIVARVARFATHYVPHIDHGARSLMLGMRAALMPDTSVPAPLAEALTSANLFRAPLAGKVTQRTEPIRIAACRSRLMDTLLSLQVPDGEWSLIKSRDLGQTVPEILRRAVYNNMPLMAHARFRSRRSASGACLNYQWVALPELLVAADRMEIDIDSCWIAQKTMPLSEVIGPHARHPGVVASASISSSLAIESIAAAIAIPSGGDAFDPVQTWVRSSLRAVMLRHALMLSDNGIAPIEIDISSITAGVRQQDIGRTLQFVDAMNDIGFGTLSAPLSLRWKHGLVGDAA